MNFLNHSRTKNLYDKDYFECGEETGRSLYTDYRWLPELTIPFCAELIARLGIHHVDTILDFGCAKGYMVKAFRLLHREAFGVDVSEYAVACAPEDVKPYITLIRSSGDIPLLLNPYSWIIAKDVFEHVAYDELESLLRKLRTISHCLFAIIPLGDGDKFLTAREEKDITHQIREGAPWWRDRLIEAGFARVEAGYDLLYILDGNCGKGWFRCG